MAILATERPKNFRTLILSIPYKHKQSHKYSPKRYVPGEIESGVRPSAIQGEVKENWRIDTLATPSPYKQNQKYVYVPEPGCGSGVSPGTLTGEGTTRSIDLSKPYLRSLQISHDIFKEKGHRKLVKHIDKTIEQTWKTEYMYYRKQIEDKRKKKEERLRRANKGTGTKSKADLKAERQARIDKWIAERAIPKQEEVPEKEQKEPAGKPDAARLAQMAEPALINPKYIRHSIDPNYVDPYSVTPWAKQYIATERVIELSKNPPHRLIAPEVNIPGAVRRSALKGKVPSNCDVLATPRKKMAEKQTDMKENPFQVSPLALTGKFPKRVLELCKPVER